MIEAATFGFKLKCALAEEESKIKILNYVEIEYKSRAKLIENEAIIGEFDAKLREREYKKIIREDENEEE